MTWNGRVLILLAAAGLTLAALPLLPPIPQPAGYHRLADTRVFFGIPNFWNVVSNIPFALVGLAGLRLRGPVSVRVIFASVFLVTFGSAYYHWDPSDATLLWDRLPITLGFMAILSTVIAERVSEKAGAWLLWPLLALGIISLVVWRLTGDLRLYVWVQFFPILALPLLFWLFPGTHSSTAYWLGAIALYAAAKVFEFYDAAFFAAGHVVSGHTLKHLLAAAACFVILRNLQKQQPLSASAHS